MNIFHTLLNLFFPPSLISRQWRNPACIQSIPSPRDTPHAWIFSRWSYKDPFIQKTIRTLKNKKDIELCTALAKHLAPFMHIHIDKHTKESFFLIPIPLSKKRQEERGHNQSKILAESLVCHLPNTLLATDILIKIKETQKQALITHRKERLINPAGSFSVVDPREVVGKNFILIDDVTTTGATLAEARRVLLEAGASSVCAITAAH